MSSRGFPIVCTNEEARELFRNKGLSYRNITEGYIAALMIFLDQELKSSNKTGETSVNTMHMSKKIRIRKRTNGSIISCYLFMNSHYFTQRECISFNENGFIGFAGWADDGNLNPIKRAFIKWCEMISSNKIMIDQMA